MKTKAAQDVTKIPCLSQPYQLPWGVLNLLPRVLRLLGDGEYTVMHKGSGSTDNAKSRSLHTLGEGVSNTMVEHDHSGSLSGYMSPPSVSSAWNNGALDDAPMTLLDGQIDLSVAKGKPSSVAALVSSTSLHDDPTPHPNVYPPSDEIIDEASAQPEAWIRIPRTALPAADTHDALRVYSQPEKRYGWLGKLGEGGAGEVLLVKDHLVSRQVAMKRVKLSSFYNAQRFLQEVRVIGRLEHPNIVPVYDVGVDREGNHFFTMKYVEGETLASVIKKLRAGDAETHKQFPIEHRVRIFVEILKAIRYAHDQGVLHLDLKPSNIMLGAYGEIMVMDWGSSRHLESTAPFVPDSSSASKPFSPQTLDGTLVGTPAYMSPEQALGKRKELDVRSDIYSLCVMFYEFLCLHHYLEHKQSLQEMLFAIISEKPIPADTFSASEQGRVPRDLWFFLEKGLFKDPQLRYDSVSEMIAALELHLNGRPSIHCPSTLLKRLALDYAQFLDTYRTMGVSWAMLVILLAVLGIFQLGAWIGKW